MEAAFDGFFEKHHLKLHQYLQLLRYEQSFQEVRMSSTCHADVQSVLLHIMLLEATRGLLYSWSFLFCLDGVVSRAYYSSGEGTVHICEHSGGNRTGSQKAGQSGIQCTGQCLSNRCLKCAFCQMWVGLLAFISMSKF